jgi:hypothetical protein
MKTISALALLVAVAAADISDIREMYYSAWEMIENGELYTTDLIINSAGKMYPATGTYGVTLRFHWVISEENYPDSELLMITASSVHAAVEQYQEYLYAPDGELIFHFRSGGYHMNEERFYFTGGVLVRYIENGTSTDRPDEEASLKGNDALHLAGGYLEAFRLLH